MEEGRRTIRTVEKKIAAFFRENRRMPTYSEMLHILGVRSKSVVHFWVKRSGNELLYNCWSGYGGIGSYSYNNR